MGKEEDGVERSIRTSKFRRLEEVELLWEPMMLR
jgi:hypothetical protein